MYLFLTGILMLLAILSLFWLMDRRGSPKLARIAYSGLIARLAVLGAAFTLLGQLLILARVTNS